MRQSNSTQFFGINSFKLWLLASLSSFFVITSGAAALSGSGREIQGFAEIDGAKIFYKHRLADEGKPTFVLANGLTFTTEDWTAFLQHLQVVMPGYGVVRYDMRGQGRTLETSPIHLQNKDTIPAQQQAHDLFHLVEHLNLKNYYLLGLSYGGAIVTIFDQIYPGKAKEIVAVAPYVAPLEQQDSQIRELIRMVRANPFNPFNRLSEEDLYNFFLEAIVVSTYPAAEPGLFRGAMFPSTLLMRLNGVFRMVKGIREINLINFAKDLKKSRLHLIVPEADEYVPTRQYFDFWSQLSPEVRGLRFDLHGTRHKVSTEIPGVLASILRLLIEKRSYLETVGSPGCEEHLVGAAKPVFKVFPDGRYMVEHSSGNKIPLHP